MSRKTEPLPSKLPPFEPCNENGCADGWRQQVDLNGKYRATPCQCMLAWREKCKQEQSA